MEHQEDMAKADAGHKKFDLFAEVMKRRTNRALTSNVQYEEFQIDEADWDSSGIPGEGIRRSSCESPKIERPPLRFIDQFIRPELPCCDITKRFTVAFLASMGFLVIFGIRCNVGVAMVKMLDNSTGKPEFTWSQETVALVDSSYFLGYLITNVPGGFYATKSRATLIFGTAIALSSVLNLLIPISARQGYRFLMLVEFAQGLVEGVTYPACHGIWRWWAPPLECSRLTSLAYSGTYGGAVLAMPLSAYLITWYGWPAPFYVYGILGTVWYLMWLWLVFEKPSRHPTISAREVLYIEKSIGPVSSIPPNFQNTPWRDILLSMPVWAIVVANFCRSWTFNLLINSQATYFRDIFKLRVSELGILAALPHLLLSITVPIGGILADHFRSTGFMTTTQVRKLFNCGGFGMFAVFLLFVADAKNNTDWAITWLTLGLGISGFAISGFNVNHLDIAPRYAGILMGISNGMGTISGLLCSIVVERITKDETDMEWGKVFTLAALIHLVGVVFYALFASGELQSWAEPLSPNYEDAAVQQNQFQDDLETSTLNEEPNQEDDVTGERELG